HEFMSAIAEMSNPQLKRFREALDKIEVPEHLKIGESLNTGSALQYLANALRKLLGLSLDEGNALFKALKLQDELLESPKLNVHMPDGTIHKIKVGTPETNTRLAKATIEEVEQNLKQGIGHTVGSKLAWNGYKTVSGYSEWGKVLLNDPLGSNPGNVQNIRQAYRTQWVDKYRTVWEEELRSALHADGVKWYDWLVNPKKVREAQNKYAKEVTEAMAHKENGTYKPKDYSEPTQRIVDTMDSFSKEAAKELVEMGLLSPEVLKGNGGYFARRWNPEFISETVDNIARSHFGGDETKALNYLATQFGNSIRYSGLSDKLRFEYGRAMIQRSLAKADNTDLIYRGHLGMDTAYEVRRMLQNNNVDPKG
ncbi:MAG: hypothetical protein ACRC9P_07635, partial [Bacteroides sp.]